MDRGRRRHARRAAQRRARRSGAAQPAADRAQRQLGRLDRAPARAARNGVRRGRRRASCRAGQRAGAARRAPGQGRADLAVIRRLLALAGALWLAACGEAEPEWPAPSPALWEISGDEGPQGWLFGTIHALPDGVEWRTSPLETAIGEADLLVVEIAGLGDREAAARAFSAVSRSPGLPPLLQRVSPGERAVLAAALDRAGLDEGDLASVESWAAALTIANATRVGEAANGVDRALLAEGLPVVALETLAGQHALC